MASKALDIRLEALSAKCDGPLENNVVRRRLHAEVSLLEMDVEEELAKIVAAGGNDNRNGNGNGANKGSGSAEEDKLQQQLESLAPLIAKLDLHFVKRRGVLLTVLDLLDEAMRILAVWLFLVDSAFLLAVPAVLLDLVYPHQTLTVLAKQFVGHACLLLSAVTLTVTGLDMGAFSGACTLLCFSHASTMDAFILSAAVPVRHYSLAKSTLFLIPFFSWHLAAYGGVAIDRNDKTQAISALSAAAASARSGDCVAVAPEGTRSKSGQLLPFKKGPFYLWESLQVAVIPVVIYGAYELYPPGKQMSLAGKVVMHFLPPVAASEASSREHMGRIVRRRMLQALASAPDNVGDTAVMTLADRRGNLLAMAAVFLLNALLTLAARSLVLGGGVSLRLFLAASAGATGLITACLYVFKVYVQPRLIVRRAGQTKPGAKSD